MFASFTEPLVLLLDEDGKSDREAAELLICALQGIVHCQVTMSGYPWAPTETLVDVLVRSMVLPTMPLRQNPQSGPAMSDAWSGAG